MEESCLSGELKLSNRKLKEFPKNFQKFNLSDTVFAGKVPFVIEPTIKYVPKHTNYEKTRLIRA